MTHKEMMFLDEIVTFPFNAVTKAMQDNECNTLVQLANVYMEQYEGKKASKRFADAFIAKYVNVDAEQTQDAVVEQNEVPAQEQEIVKDQEETQVQPETTPVTDKRAEAAKKQSAYLKFKKQYNEMKAKHPEKLLLFKVGDFYETYFDDAEEASKVLGIVLTKTPKRKDGRNAGFPYTALDTYLPKLVRAGKEVVICDKLD